MFSVPETFNIVNGNVQPKSVLKNRKSEFDVCLDDDGLNHHVHEDSSRLSNSETEVNVFLELPPTRTIFICSDSFFCL